MLETYECEFHITNETEMQDFGAKVAKRLFKGAFIALFGDLGAGKTTFVRGLARELGITSISSPTFNIVRCHTGKTLDLAHFDAYRLSGSDELYSVGFEEYLDSGSVIVMEWCENVYDALPEKRLDLHIIGSGSGERIVGARSFGENYRKIILELQK